MQKIDAIFAMMPRATKARQCRLTIVLPPGAARFCAGIAWPRSAAARHFRARFAAIFAGAARYRRYAAILLAAAASFFQDGRMDNIIRLSAFSTAVDDIED